ncbi:hypothetical protein ACWC3Y_11025 [Streptomyces sp. NPDC001296]
MTQPLTNQQLDEYEALAANLYEYADQPEEADTLCDVHVPALVAEVRRLRARVTELEGPAVEARAALAAFCYDLEDPGTAALGALYLLQQATVGVEAPRDDTVLALARHASEVLERTADMADPEPPEASFFGDYGPQVADWLRRRADYAVRDAAPKPATAPAARSVPAV